MTASAASAPIVVFGSVNMDLVTSTGHLPAPGETVLGNGFATIPGGKGGNQAIAAAHAGGRVKFIGATGLDGFGSQLRDALITGGVAVDHLRQTAGPSGIAAITVDQAGENTIVVVAGANGTMTGLTDPDRDAIGSAAILVCQLEVPMSGVMSAVHTAAAASVPVLLNPSPVRDLPSELMAGVTVLVVNEGEARALGTAALAQVPHLVTTLGADGARYRGPAGEFAVAAPHVIAVDTTGAGDAFAGVLAVAWANGIAPRPAIQRACAAGALATTTAGAGGSAPSRAEIDELVAATYRP